MKAKGSAIVERIDALLAERGQTRKALVSAGAVKSVTSLTDWLQRETVPRADAALAVADYLGVSVRWLITGKDGQDLSVEERNLLIKYQMLTWENQRNIQALINSMLSVPTGGGGGSLVIIKEEYKCEGEKNY